MQSSLFLDPQPYKSHTFVHLSCTIPLPVGLWRVTGIFDLWFQDKHHQAEPLIQHL